MRQSQFRTLVWVLWVQTDNATCIKHAIFIVSLKIHRSHLASHRLERTPALTLARDGKISHRLIANGGRGTVRIICLDRTVIFL